MKTFIIIICILSLLILSLCSFDTYDEAKENEQDLTESNIDNVSASHDGGEDKNYFDILYEHMKENIGKILSALGCLISLILMFLYKKGFLPALEGGIKALAAAVTSIGEKTDKISEGTNELGNGLSAKLEECEEALSHMATNIAQLNEKILCAEEAQNEKAAIKTVMLAEVDMLYEIFMAAELPQYLKDNVGERIAAMKNVLRESAEQ